MSYRNVPFVRGEFYHIYSRGNSKQKIFLDDYDRTRFTHLLYLCNSISSINYRDDVVRAGIDPFDYKRDGALVAIGAWVLMDNHFHLYLSIAPRSDLGEEKNAITEFMRKLLTSYAQYFNTKYKRTGGLFEGKFKATHITNEPQAKYNFSYIHLNPVKLIDKNWKEKGIQNIKKAIKFLDNYKWSSYLDYKGIVRPENKILDRENFLDYFQNIKDFDSEIMEWLKFREEE